MNYDISEIPFLTSGTYCDKEYIGIIGNKDDQFMSMYVFSDIKDAQLRTLFLEICEEWWWETNRKIPISIIMKDRWTIFKPYLKTFITKEFNLTMGPETSIDNLIKKKIKRKQISIK